MNVSLGGIFKAVSGSFSMGMGKEEESLKQAMQYFQGELFLTLVRFE
jgi:hypothetical protein